MERAAQYWAASDRRNQHRAAIRGREDPSGAPGEGHDARGEQAMSTQLLIYKSAVPISRTTHHDCFVDIGSNFAFTANVNSVPLMAVEFPQAASEYAVVFGGTEADLTPAAILGVRSN